MMNEYDSHHRAKGRNAPSHRDDGQIVTSTAARQNDLNHPLRNADISFPKPQSTTNHNPGKRSVRRSHSLLSPRSDSGYLNPERRSKSPCSSDFRDRRTNSGHPASGFPPSASPLFRLSGGISLTSLNLSVNSWVYDNSAFHEGFCHEYGNYRFG